MASTWPPMAASILRGSKKAALVASSRRWRLIWTHDMTDMPGNPLGLDGFAFLEFTSPDPVVMAKKLLALGFVAAARKRDGLLFRPGRIAFVIKTGRPAGRERGGQNVSI